MATSTALLHAGVLLSSAAVSLVLAATVSRRGEVPGRTPFALFMLSIAVWTGAYAVGLLTSAPGWRITLESIAWFGRASIHVWFLLFALAYTGYDQFVTGRTVALLSVLPAALIALVWTNPWHGLVWATEPRVTAESGMALVVAAVGPAFWANVVYAYVLVAVGAALVLRLVFESEYLYADQSALLVVGIAAPFVGNAATVFPPHPIPGFDYTPYAFAVTGIAFGYALFRGGLFDLVPATRALGRSAAINQLDAGVLVVDTDRRVLYCNEAAGEVLDCAPQEALGREAGALVDDSVIDFGAEDALAEIERDEGIYEVRTSPIADRRDRTIGHTVVVHDVTARERRERRLATQRDELERIEELNAVIRGVNQALVSAGDRAEIERAVCEHLSGSDLYRTVCVADVPTWVGDADRWLVAGETDEADPEPPSLDGRSLDADAFDRDAGGAASLEDDGSDRGDASRSDRGDASESDRDDGDRPARVRTLSAPPEVAADGGTWTVVPVVSGRTVYGALGLFTGRRDVGDREREVLGELGELIGHAVEAAETRRLLSADAVVEVELERTTDADSLVAAAGGGGRVVLAGLVPNGDGTSVAYVRVDEDVATARDRLDGATAGSVRVIRDDAPGGLLEWRATGDALLGALVARGANVREAVAEDGRASYLVESSSGEAARSLVDRLREAFPGVRVVAKRERTGPIEDRGTLSVEALGELTDRQRETLEAAYRAGYFAWPRDSTAEEVARTLDITSPTLHNHLRKAQESLLGDLFDPDGERGR